MANVDSAVQDGDDHLGRNSLSHAFGSVPGIRRVDVGIGGAS
jgi:hypothetical protein